MVFDPLTLGLLAGGGALLGGGAGFLGGSSEARAQRRVGRKLREGLAQATTESREQRDVAVQSPEFQAARSFLLGNFAGVGGVKPPTASQALLGRSEVPDIITERLQGQAFNVADQLIAARHAQNQLARGKDDFGAPLDEATTALLRDRDADAGKLQGLFQELSQTRGLPVLVERLLQQAGFSLADFDKDDAFGAAVSRAIPDAFPKEGEIAPGISQQDSPLVSDFVRGIRQAQATRGTFFGAAPAVQEATGLAAFQEQMRAQLLPQLLGIVGFGEQFRQQVFPQIAQTRVQQRTRGRATFGSQLPQDVNALSLGLAGALQGFGLGGAMGIGSQTLGGQTQAPTTEFPQTARASGDFVDPLNLLGGASFSLGSPAGGAF